MSVEMIIASFKHHVLSACIFFPLAAMLIVLLIPSSWTKMIRVVALLLSLCELALCAFLFTRVAGSGDFEVVEKLSWIPSLGISYHVGLDGTSVLLILLAVFLVPISLLASWKEIDRQVKAFHTLLFLLESAVVGVFAALDIFLFYIFWEAVLIPMYFIIGIWGSSERIKAAIKFVLFTMVGSLLMLVALLYGAHKTGSFNLLTWYAHGFSPVEQMWLFGTLALAFAIKVPVIGVHTWLPDAHTEAPTAGSVILAGVLLKMGAYGFYRFAMPLFPLAVAAFAPAMLTLSVIGILVGALLAMVQPDLKRLIAYSSVSHMAFVTLGLFALQKEAVAGALLQMINHGLTTGALFLMVGMIYARRHTRKIADYGGHARSWPVITFFFLFMVFSSAGLPGLGGFPGEFLVLLGSFQTQTLFAALAIPGVVLVAVYLLWAVLRVFFGPRKPENNNDEQKKLPDLTLREWTILIPMAALILFIGIWPEFLLSKLWKPAETFVKLSQRTQMKSLDMEEKNIDPGIDDAQQE